MANFRRSPQVYANAGVCYACHMAQQLPSDKKSHDAHEPESHASRERFNASIVPAQADSITSRDNKWLKKFRAALRGHGPEQGEPIAAEGPKLVEEGVRAGLETEGLLVSETGERQLERILRAASESESGIPRSRIFKTTDKLFEGVAGTETPQGVAGLFLAREWSFEDALRGRADSDGTYRSAASLVIVMAGGAGPGEGGTILRSGGG